MEKSGREYGVQRSEAKVLNAIKITTFIHILMQ